MKKTKIAQKKLVLWGLFLALALAVFISPFASSRPDGLVRVAENLGFIKKAEQTGITFLGKAPLADYKVPGIQTEGWAKGFSGFLGTLVIVGLGWGIGRLIKHRGS